MLAAARGTGSRKQFTIRQMFLLTARLDGGQHCRSHPFALSGLHLSGTDAWFEAVSGVTASGSTVLRGLGHLPPGILLWRALLQWLGGGAFLLMSVLVLPELSIGGMQMFRLESSTAQGDRVMGRSFQVAGRMLVVYAVLTFVLTLLLGLGMSRFPAFLHAVAPFLGGSRRGRLHRSLA